MATISSSYNVKANIGILGSNMVTANIVGRRLYWYGGTGNWSDYTNHWSLNSGNSPASPASSAPTSGDDVYFDANSGAGTCTVNATASCANFTATTSTITTFNATSGQYMYVYGDFTLKAGLSWTSSRLYFSATGKGRKITTAGVTLNGATYFDGVGGGWVFQDAFRVNNGSTTFTNGSIDTNNQNWDVGWGLMSTGTTERWLTLGSTSVTVGGSGTNWFIISTNFTLNAGTSTITQGTSNGGFYGGSGLVYNNLVVNLGSSLNEFSFLHSNTFNNVTFNGGAGKITAISFPQPITVRGTLTVTGNSIVNRLLVKSSSAGTAVELNCAAVSLTNVDFRDISARGAATWSGTSIGDCLGNNNITFTQGAGTDNGQGGVYRYWVAVSGGNWSSTSSWSTTDGGASGASVPLAHDTPVFTANSITTDARTITVDVQRIGVLDFTNIAHSPSLRFSQITHIHGTTITLASGMNCSITSTVYLFGRTTTTYTSNGAVLSYPGQYVLQLYLAGGTLQLGDDTVIEGMVYASGNGYFNSNGYDFSCGSFLMSNFSSRANITLTNSTLTLTSSSGSILDLPSSGTMNVTGSTIVASDTSANAKNFYCRNATFNNVTITGNNISLYNTGGVWMNTLTLNNPGAANGTKLNNGATFYLTNFAATGTPGSLIIIQSTSAGSVATLSKTSGRVVCNYLSIKDSTATGGAQWYAGNNSTRLTNVNGWLFEDPWDNAVVANITPLLHSSVKAYIYSPGVSQDASVKANIRVTVINDVSVKASVVKTVSSGQSAKASVLTTAVMGGSSKANIRVTNTNGNSAKSSVVVTVQTINSSNGNIIGIIQRPNSVGAFIFRQNELPVSTKANIVRRETYGEQVRLNVVVINQKSQSTKASIVVAVSQQNSTKTNVFSIISTGNSSRGYIENGKRYWVGDGGNWNNTAHWSHTSGGLGGASIPNEYTDVYFDENSFTLDGQTVTKNVWTYVHNMDWTGVLHNPTLNATSTFYIYGSLKLIEGMTIPQYPAPNWVNMTFEGFADHSESKTIETAGRLITNFIIETENTGDTFTLVDDLHAYSFELYNGTFDANDHNVESQNYWFESWTGNQPTLYMGSGVWDALDYGTIWSLEEGSGIPITIYPETSTIKLSYAGANLTTFDSVTPKSYYKLWLANSGSGAYYIKGANTFYEIRTDSSPHTLYFDGGQTTIVTRFLVAGTDGNLITINSADNATQHTLSMASGIVEGDYLSIKNSNATGGAYWGAGLHSVNVGNNTGWMFPVAYDSAAVASIYYKDVAQWQRVTADILAQSQHAHSVKASIVVFHSGDDATKSNIRATYPKPQSAMANVIGTGQSPNATKTNILRTGEQQGSNTKASVVVTVSGSWATKSSIVRTEPQPNVAKSDIKKTLSYGHNVKSDIIVTASAVHRVKSDIKRIDDQVINRTRADVLVRDNANKHFVKADIWAVQTANHQTKSSIIWIGVAYGASTKSNVRVNNNRVAQSTKSSIVTTNADSNRVKADVLRINEACIQSVKVDIKRTESYGQSARADVWAWITSANHTKASIVVTNAKPTQVKADIKDTYTARQSVKMDIITRNVTAVQRTKADVWREYSYDQRVKFDVIDTYHSDSVTMAVIHHPTYVHCYSKANISPKQANYTRASVDAGTYDIYVDRGEPYRRLGGVYRDFL